MPSSRRRYEPHAGKHKWPIGFGSLCPHPFPMEVAQDLLDRAIADDRRLWAASGRWCFCAHLTRTDGEEEVWHGFPVIGAEVPDRVLRELRSAGFVDAREARRLRGQRALPEAWP